MEMMIQLHLSVRTLAEKNKKSDYYILKNDETQIQQIIRTIREANFLYL